MPEPDEDPRFLEWCRQACVKRDDTTGAIRFVLRKLRKAPELADQALFQWASQGVYRMRYTLLRHQKHHPMPGTCPRGFAAIQGANKLQDRGILDTPILPDGKPLGDMNEEDCVQVEFMAVATGDGWYRRAELIKRCRKAIAGSGKVVRSVLSQEQVAAILAEILGDD